MFFLFWEVAKRFNCYVGRLVCCKCRSQPMLRMKCNALLSTLCECNKGSVKDCSNQEDCLETNDWAYHRQVTHDRVILSNHDWDS